jgi:hypothetical protein
MEDLTPFMFKLVIFNNNAAFLVNSPIVSSNLYRRYVSAECIGIFVLRARY